MRLPKSLVRWADTMTELFPSATNITSEETKARWRTALKADLKGCWADQDLSGYSQDIVLCLKEPSLAVYLTLQELPRITENEVFFYDDEEDGLFHLRFLCPTQASDVYVKRVVQIVNFILE